MAADFWTVTEAKAKFSQLLARARSSGPQTITSRGRVAAVVVSAEEWGGKVKRVGNLAEFFAASPLRGQRMRTDRIKGGLRKVDLG